MVWCRSSRAAERFLHRSASERAAFVRKHFGANLDDPLGYDLVLNTSQIDADRADDVIVSAYRIRFGEWAPPAVGP